jgi:hypothetical protein
MVWLSTFQPFTWVKITARRPDKSLELIADRRFQIVLGGSLRFIETNTNSLSTAVILKC